MRDTSAKAIVDTTGRTFPSIKAAASAYCIGDSNLARGLARTGEYYSVKNSVGFRYADAAQPKQVSFDAPAVPVDPVLREIAERYTPDELALLAKGELHDQSLRYPKVHLHGRRHRIGVISDTHIGSMYFPPEWLTAALDEFEKTGCECILHAGDLVEGMKLSRMGTQIYELTELGYKAQRDKAVELFSRCQLPIYIISGNHDAYFKENAGANIVEDVCYRVPCMTYLGHDMADIDIDGATLRLFHGGDGSAYAHSYRIQKLIESFPGGGKKPAILLAGHVHKYCHVFERNIQALSVPCLQMQTGYMRAKKLPAHCGFLILDFEVLEGQVVNFAVKYTPFYE